MGIKDISPLNYIEHFQQIDGKLWICASNGIGAVDKEGFHLLRNLPMDKSIVRILVDYAGNLWFASSRQGIMKIVPNQFSDLYDRYHVPEDVVNTTCKYGDQMFIGTDSGLTVLGSLGIVEHLPLTKAVTASGEDIGTTDLIEWLKGCRIRSITRGVSGSLPGANMAFSGMIRARSWPLPRRMVCFQSGFASRPRRKTARSW